jgi:hypothetical protein
MIMFHVVVVLHAASCISTLEESEDDINTPPSSEWVKNMVALSEGQ